MPSEDRPAGQRLHRRIFVSSSNVDLFAHRAAVSALLLKMDQQVVGMEHFGAQDGDATEVSLDELAGADVALFLVAWRYGTIPDHETRSVTHLEYEAAKDRKMPRFVFLAAPSTEADDGPQALFPAERRNPEHNQQLLAFREELRHDRVADFFTTPDNLAAQVSPAVTRHLLGEQFRELLRSLGLRPPRDLPPPVPGFVGREWELADLCEQLRQGHSTGLSAAVAGMAGVGKSALAAEAVHQLATEPGLFPGGITFVRCDGQTGLAGLSWVYDRLLAAWNAALTAEERARATTPEEEMELRERLLRTRLRPNDLETEDARTAEATYRGQQALVLLDNVERELPLARLLDTLAALGFIALVTARHHPATPRLQVRSLEVLDAEAAVQLFAERFHAAEGTWEAARDTGPAGEVVAVLGYLPLAIELAAARAGQRRMRVADLTHDLRTADQLGQLRDPLDPTKNVRYVFDQSLSQLPSPQQLAFAALSLPAGPDWPRKVIESYLAYLLSASPTAADVAPAPEETLLQAQADLETLVAWSLVSLVVDETEAVETSSEPTSSEDGALPTGTDTGGRLVRVRVHPLLRTFAAISWPQQSAAVRQAGPVALLAAVGDLVKAHAAMRQTDFAVLAQEEALIVGALEGVETGHDTASVEEGETAAQELLVEVVANLGKYLSTGGHWRLGMHLRTLQLQARQAVGDRSGEGTTLNNLGILAASLGQPEEAWRYYEQALVILREVGDRSMEGTTLNNLGVLADNLGQPKKARSYYEQALPLLREVGDRSGEGTTLNNLGQLVNRLGQPEKAWRYYEQALVILREVGDRSMEGTTLNNLGVLADNLGVLADNLGQSEWARSYFEQALPLLREVGDRRGEGATLSNLGSLADNLGQPEEARSYYEQALALYEALGATREAQEERDSLLALDRAALTAPTAAPSPGSATRRKLRWWPFGR